MDKQKETRFNVVAKQIENETDVVKDCVSYDVDTDFLRVKIDPIEDVHRYLIRRYILTGDKSWKDFFIEPTGYPVFKDFRSAVRFVEEYYDKKTDLKCDDYEYKKNKDSIDKKMDAYRKAYKADVSLPKFKVNDCFKYCSDSIYKPSMSGMYHDPNGFAVVTDGHIIYAHTNLYDKEMSGEIRKSDGTKQEGVFPNWKSVIPSMEIRTKLVIDRDALYRQVCLFEKKSKYRGTYKEQPYFTLVVDGKHVFYNADYLKGLLLMSYAHNDATFYIANLYDETRHHSLIVEHEDCSIGMTMPIWIGSDRAAEDINNYGLLRSFYKDCFLIDGVYQCGVEG